MSNAFNAEVVVDDAFRYSKSYRVRYKGNMCVTSFSVDYNFEYSRGFLKLFCDVVSLCNSGMGSETSFIAS